MVELLKFMGRADRIETRSIHHDSCRNWLLTATNPRTAAIEATTAALKQAGLRTADCAMVFASTAYGGAYPHDRAQRGGGCRHA